MTKVLTLLFIIFASVVGNQANAVEKQKLDYSKLKPEHFSNLEHKMEFSDDEGNSYRVLNTDRNRCLEIRVTVGESKRWRKHGACYTFSRGKKTSVTESHLIS
jgi:hypothetical protein